MGAHVLYPVAAGSTRCFLSGWLAGAAVRVLARAPVRVGAGLLPSSRPGALAAALGGACAAYHAVRLVLRRVLRSPRAAAMRAALAGCTAAGALAFLRPELAGIETELHTSVVTSALLSTVRSPARPSRSADGDEPRGASVSRNATTTPLRAARARAAVVAIAPVLVGGAALWRLLSARAAHPGVLAPSAATWLRPLAATSCGDAAATSLLAAAWRGWWHGARAHGIARVAYLLLPSARPAATRGAAADERARRLPARLVPAPAAMLRWAHDAAVAGGLSAACACLLAAGPAACTRAGWLPGLALLALPRARRTELAIRLSYHAALNVGGAEGAAALAPGGGARTACGALLLGGAAARLCHQYALVAAGLPSTMAARSARALHFLLGFDEAEFDGYGESARPDGDSGAAGRVGADAPAASAATQQSCVVMISEAVRLTAGTGAPLSPTRRLAPDGTPQDTFGD